MIISTNDFEEKGNALNNQLTTVDLDKHELLLKMTQELEHSFHNPDLKIDKVAKNIALSERQIYRTFKRTLNITPTLFIRSYRLEKAFRFIKEGDSLGNIAFNIGFSSHSYFCRCFKEKYQVTPSEFMERLAIERRQNIINSWQNINI